MTVSFYMYFPPNGFNHRHKLQKYMWTCAHTYGFICCVCGAQCLCNVWLNSKRRSIECMKNLFLTLTLTLCFSPFFSVFLIRHERSYQNTSMWIYWIRVCTYSSSVVVDIFHIPFFSSYYCSVHSTSTSTVSIFFMLRLWSFCENGDVNNENRLTCSKIMMC